jgi:transcriptional regulator with XRE-family HTH domain
MGSTDNKPDIQIQLFQRIRDRLPGHVSLVDEIAELLEISNDSAYRRIRGEKQISVQELQLLAGAFQLSVDDLMAGQVDTITFSANFLNESSYSFTDWLSQLLGFTRLAASADQSEAIFILNELNIFHIIQFPELCAFKLFFWQKSNLDFPKLRGAGFSVDDMPDETFTLSSEIAENYVKVNTIEFTTRECLNSILKQILFYAESGYFKNRQDALSLCARLHELVNHQQKQAELGYKFIYGRQPAGHEGNLRLYYNDIILADNTIMVSAGESKATFLTSNAINLMRTYNSAFFEYNYQWGRNLLSKSIPISGTAEKERNRFFLQLREQIDRVAEQL